MKILFLMSFLSILLMFLGGVFAGQIGLIFALIMSILFHFASYWFSDKIILSLYNAHKIEITDKKYSYLYNLLSETSILMDLKTPSLYLIDSQALNAFATGRNQEHSAVVLTKGLLDILNQNELKGVLAHELSHIKNSDIFLSSVVALLSSMISNLAYFAKWVVFLGGRDKRYSLLETILFIFFAPISAFFVQMLISRTQEFRADNGAKQVGLAKDLVFALKKISINSNPNKAILKPETAHLFIYNPLKNNGLVSLFSTHPPLKERIEKLLS